MENRQCFNKPIIEIIKSRTSIRTYKDQPLNDEIKKKLEDFCRCVKGPFNSEFRFKIVDKNIKNPELKIGTYGVIRGATCFIAGAVKNGDNNLEQMGFVFEKVVLYATSLGLGTCWLGGTFKRSDFSEEIGLNNDEIIPAVSPVGYTNQNRSIKDSIIRFTAGSKNRKKFEDLFFDKSFSNPLSEMVAGKYSVPLEMVRLCPSASNKQPWRIVKDNNNFHFYLHHTKGYGNALGFDIQRIDIGIAMCHFELTMHELGIKGSWNINRTEIEDIPNSNDFIVSWLEK